MCKRGSYHGVMEPPQFAFSLLTRSLRIPHDTLNRRDADLVDETNEWMFQDHPDAVDVDVRAGQLVIADARLLHGTHPNTTDERRTLLLGWFFRRDTRPPKWWSDDVPEEIVDRDPLLKTKWTRQPGGYLR